MEKFTTYVPLIARILIGLLFLWSGIEKLANVSGFVGYLTSGGLPAIFAWPTIAVEFLGGLALILGFQTRIAALILAAFTLAAALLYHLSPFDQINFFKNLAITGGLLLLFANGAGPVAVDKR